MATLRERALERVQQRQSISSRADVESLFARSRARNSEFAKELERKRKNQQLLSGAQEQAQQLQKESQSLSNRFLRATEPQNIGRGIVDIIGGGVRKVSDALFQNIKDEATFQSIQKNNETFIKAHDLMRNAKTKSAKEAFASDLVYLAKQNDTLSKVVGGDIKNATDRQLLGMALEAAIEVGTVGGGSILRGSLLKSPKLAKAIAKTAKLSEGTSKIAKTVRGATSARGIGAQTGGAISASQALQENEDIKEILKQTAIGAGLGLGLVVGTEYVAKKAPSVVNKIFRRNEDVIEAPTLNQGVNLNRSTKGQDTTDFIRSQEGVKVTKLNENIVDPLNGKEYTTHIEYDPKEKTGEVIISNNATKEDIDIASAKLITVKEPKLATKFEDTITEITGGEKTLAEDTSDAIYRVMTDEKLQDKYPEFANEIKKQGIDLDKTAKEAKLVAKETATEGQSKVAKDAQQIYKKLEKDVEDGALAGYTKQNMKEQADKVSNISKSDRLSMLTGEKNIPDDVNIGVFTRIMQHSEDKDIIKALTKSNLATSISEAAQTLAGRVGVNSDSAATKAIEITQKRRKKSKSKVKKTKMEMKNFVKKERSKVSWADYVNSIKTC